MINITCTAWLEFHNYINIFVAKDTRTKKFLQDQLRNQAGISIISNHLTLSHRRCLPFERKRWLACLQILEPCSVLLRVLAQSNMWAHYIAQ